MYGFVYRTKNLLNGKFYIGKRRLLGNYKDKSYFGSSIALLADIDKYGRENFQRQIIKYCETKEELDYWERRLTEILNPTLSSEVGYNRRFGNGKLSDEVKKKIGKGNKGKVISEEARKIISKKLMGNKNPSGRVVSQRTREIMSAKLKGNKNAVKIK